MDRPKRFTDAIYWFTNDTGVSGTSLDALYCTRTIFNFVKTHFVVIIIIIVITFLLNIFTLPIYLSRRRHGLNASLTASS